MGYYLNVDRFGNEIVETGAPDVVLAPVSYVPTSTGNANNKNSFVIDPNGEVWFIDTNGDAVKVSSKDVVTTLTNVIAGHKIGTYTNELGAVVDINETVTSLNSFTISGSTISIEYIDETGVPATKSITLPSDVVTSLTDTITGGHKIGTYTNENGTPVDIKETITGIVDNGDGSFTYTDEAGVAHTIDVASCCVSGFVEHVTTLKNNGDGTFTYTNEEGTEVSFASSAGTPCLDVLSAVQPTPAPTGNTSNTNSVFKDAAGDTWIVDCSGDAIKAGSSAAAETITAIANTIVGHKIGDYTNEAGVVKDINETITSVSDLSISGNTLTLKYIDEAGVENVKSVTLPSDVVSSLTNAITGHKIGTYTNESGVAVDINETITALANVLASGHKIGDYTNEDGVNVVINETVTSLVDNGNGTATYTNENGVDVIIPLGAPANWVDATTDPSATGNTGTLPRFVYNTVNGSKWYIDANGVAKLIEGAATNCGVVYFNSVDPSAATIFDTENPPVTNNDALKNLDCALYIGTDGSVWTSNGTSYATKVDSAPLHNRDLVYATAGQTAFTISKVAIGSTEKVHVTRNGIDISHAWTWVGTAGTYIPASNANKTMDAGDRVIFHYEAY